MNFDALINLLTLLGLIAIMLSMGLKVKVEDVLASARNPRQVIFGLVANFLVVPAVTMSLLYLFAVNPLVSVGFLIMAVCPGAPITPPLVGLAKGDIPSSISQMVILAGSSAILSPFLLSLFLGQFLPPGEFQIDYLGIIRTLLVAQMIPLAIGLGVHHWAPRFSCRIVGPIGLLANLLLVAVIVLLMSREYETLALVKLRGWFGMVLLLGVSVVVGWVCGGPGRATRKTLALTSAVRNIAVALVIASTNFADTPAVSAVVAYGLFSILATLGFAFLFAKLPESGKAG